MFVFQLVRGIEPKSEKKKGFENITDGTTKVDWDRLFSSAGLPQETMDKLKDILGYDSLPDSNAVAPDSTAEESVLDTIPVLNKDDSTNVDVDSTHADSASSAVDSIPAPLGMAKEIFVAVGEVPKEISSGVGNSGPFPPPKQEIALTEGVTAVNFSCTITDEGKAETRQRAYAFSLYDHKHQVETKKGSYNYPFPTGLPHLRAEIEEGKVYLDTDGQKYEREHSVDIGETFNVLVVLDQNAGTWSMHMQRQSEEYKELAKGEFDVEKYVKDGKLNAVVGGVYSTNSKVYYPEKKKGESFNKIGIEVKAL